MNQLVDPFWLWLLAKIAAALTSFAVINRFLIKPLRVRVFDKVKDFHHKVNAIYTVLGPGGASGSLRTALDATNEIAVKLDQRQRNFFQMDIHGIFEVDNSGNWVWMNRALLDTMRRQPDDLLGNGWRSCVADKDRLRVTTEAASAITDRRDLFMNCDMLDIEGRLVPVEIRMLRMVDTAGKLIGHLGFLVRTDLPPLGCRWCRTIEDLTKENYGPIKNQLEIEKAAHKGPAVES